MNDFDRPRPAALHRTSNARRRPAKYSSSCVDVSLSTGGASCPADRGTRDSLGSQIPISQVESLTEAREVLSVNLEGALASIAGVLPDMRRRSRGQIAIVSSMAAYMGIAQAPVYGASKAALKTYGEALRAWLRPQGIAVSVVLLGFVRTRMTEQFRGPKPMLVSPETAARCIRRGLERNRARILCPRALGWGLLCLSVLPSALAERIMRTFGYRS